MLIRFKKFYGLVAGLMLASLMVACGDATATPAPAATTAAPGTTVAATTVAATSAAVATTAAPVANTAATSAAVTTSIAPSTAAATTAATSTAIAEYDAGGLKVIDPRPNYKIAPAGKKGGNLNLGDTSEAKSLHPFLTSDTVSSGWQQYLYEAALVETDVQTGLPAPAFKVISALKVSQDKLTYTFTLKDGIKWSDGQPIVAEDYAWTYAQVLKPENKWPYIQDYADLIDTVTAPDAKTVVFKFKQPEVYALSNAGLEPLPKHIWDGKDWGDSTKNPEIDNPSVVSGPWKLKEWKRGQYVIFARNDASTIYPVPLLDTVTIQIVKDSKVLFQKFKAGEIDVTGVSPTDYDEAKKAPNTTLLEYFRPSFGFTYTGFNFRKTYLQDIELRKALAYATPQQTLIDKLLNGVGQPIYSAVAQTNIMYSSQTPKYEFSIDKAKATLTAAGYKIEGGKLKDKAGKEIPKLKFLYQTGSPIGEGIAVVSQQNWKELGIEMELVPLEFQAFVNQIKKEPFDYDLFGGAWSSTADVETFDQVWKAIPSLNAGAWDTAVAKQVIELHKKARQEFDFAKRKELMAQIQTLTAQDLPYIFLWQQKTLAAVSNKVIISPLLNNGIAYNYRSDWSLK